MPDNYTISVVVFQDGPWWVAQCLEYNIGTQAKSLPDLYYEVERTLVGRLTVAAELRVDPFESLPPAPKRYWTMFEHAKLHLSRDRLPFRMPASLASRVPVPELRIAELV